MVQRNKCKVFIHQSQRTGEYRVYHRPLLRHRHRLVPHRFVLIEKRVPEPAPRIRRLAFLFLGMGSMTIRTKRVPCLTYLKKRDLLPLNGRRFPLQVFSKRDSPPGRPVRVREERRVGLGIWVASFVYVWENLGDTNRRR